MILKIRSLCHNILIWSAFLINISTSIQFDHNLTSVRPERTATHYLSHGLHLRPGAGTSRSCRLNLVELGWTWLNLLELGGSWLNFVELGWTWWNLVEFGFPDISSLTWYDQLQLQDGNTFPTHFVFSRSLARQLGAQQLVVFSGSQVNFFVSTTMTT